MSGKGSKPRPYSVDAETFEANWERTFPRPMTAKDASAKLDAMWLQACREAQTDGVPCVHEAQGGDQEGSHEACPSNEARGH